MDYEKKKLDNRIKKGTVTRTLFFTLLILVIFISIYKYENPPIKYEYGKDISYTMLIDDIVYCYPDWTRMSEYEKINTLRSYVYSHTYRVVEQSEKGGEKDVFDGFDSDKMDLYSYELTHMNSNGNITGGMQCGGFSWTLMNLYKVLGWDSVTLDMAIFDGKADSAINSHLVCLVRYKGKWIVEDPTFDCTYVDSNGVPISIFNLIKYVDNNEYEKIITIENNESRYAIYNDSITSLEELDDYYLVDYDSIYEYDGFYYIKEKTDVDDYPISNVYEIFEKEGYKKSELSLYAYPYYINRREHDIRQIINKNIIRARLLMMGHNIYF